MNSTSSNFLPRAPMRLIRAPTRYLPSAHLDGALATANTNRNVRPPAPLAPNTNRNAMALFASSKNALNANRNAALAALGASRVAGGGAPQNAGSGASHAVGPAFGQTFDSPVDEEFDPPFDPLMGSGMGAFAPDGTYYDAPFFATPDTLAEFGVDTDTGAVLIPVYKDGETSHFELIRFDGKTTLDAPFYIRESGAELFGPNGVPRELWRDIALATTEGFKRHDKDGKVRIDLPVPLQARCLEVNQELSDAIFGTGPDGHVMIIDNACMHAAK